MELFITDLKALKRPVRSTERCGEQECGLVQLPDAAARAVHDLVIPDGMPFFLDDEGCYEPTLSKFFRDVAADGCRSPRTWIGYARDIHLFCRFLAERRHGKSILDADKDDLRAYYRSRRLSTKPVRERSWNRAVAALDRFYRWALAEGLAGELPFDYRYATVGIPGQQTRTAVQRNQFLERVGPREEVKCISLDTYLYFRDVGLLGRLPDGSPDPAFRGRNSLRNAAFAEVLVTTGTRLSEAAWMLKAELPDIDAPENAGLKTCRMQLAQATAKGRRGRPIQVPRRVLKDFLLPYIAEDRDNAVAKAAALGRYGRAENTLTVHTWGRQHCRLTPAHGRLKLEYANLSREDRARLFSADNEGFPVEPGLLWCTEGGVATHSDNFEAVFARACERCAGFGRPMSVTPHTLRHTFAVYMLSELIKASIGNVLTLRRHRRDLGEGAYRRIVLDPLGRLRRLLGHASVSSTYIYLTCLEEAQQLVDEAVGSWSDRLDSPDDMLIPVQEAT